MLGVTGTERLLRGLAAPRWLRPALGGAAVGGLGLAVPAGACRPATGRSISCSEMPLPWRELALLLLCKVVASAISVASGFRGGLFFASLLIGALGGKFFAALVGGRWRCRPGRTRWGDGAGGDERLRCRGHRRHRWR